MEAHPQFKAWDKKEKLFKRVNSIRYITEYGKSTFIIEIQNRYCNEFVTAERVDLVQFTGLQDKDGKDIYVGDILQFEGHKDASKKVVTLEYGMFCLGNDSLWHYVSKNAYVIIGNRFKNPELLNTGENDEN
ncbi:hypothetical protein GQ472_01815 [archaeon]|nr:hypothetical protein [archaeon]